MKKFAQGILVVGCLGFGMSAYAYPIYDMNGILIVNATGTAKATVTYTGLLGRTFSFDLLSTSVSGAVSWDIGRSLEVSDTRWSRFPPGKYESECSGYNQPYECASDSEVWTGESNLFGTRRAGEINIPFPSFDLTVLGLQDLNVGVKVQSRSNAELQLTGEEATKVAEFYDPEHSYRDDPKFDDWLFEQQYNILNGFSITGYELEVPDLFDELTTFPVLSTTTTTRASRYGDGIAEMVFTSAEGGVPVGSLTFWPGLLFDVVYDFSGIRFNVSNVQGPTVSGTSSDLPPLRESSSVPEPATLALFGIGLAGLGFARKKKKSA